MKNIYLMTAFAVAAVGLGDPSEAAQPAFMRKQLYPARVRAFTLPNIGVIDAAHPTSRSEWKIGFGKSLPKALYYDKPGTAPQVEIQDLVCTSPARGSRTCDITIPGDGSNCMLFVGDDLADTFTIVCPTKLDLVK